MSYFDWFGPLVVSVVVGDGGCCNGLNLSTSNCGFTNREDFGGVYCSR